MTTHTLKGWSIKYKGPSGPIELLYQLQNLCGGMGVQYLSNTLPSISKASRLTQPIRPLPPANAFFHSSTPTTLLHFTEHGKCHKQVTGAHSLWPRGQEAFSHLLMVSLWAGFTGGGSTSWWTQSAVLLPPSCRWRQARTEPALRLRAPLFSKQKEGKMKPQKACVGRKWERRQIGRYCSFRNIVKF